MEHIIVLGPQGAPSRHCLEDVQRSAGDLGDWLISEAFQCYCAELRAARLADEAGSHLLPYPRSIDEFVALDNHHQSHQAIKSFQHCLVQALSVFSIIERERLSVADLIDVKGHVHVLGFCTGALTAQAFATSTRLSQLTYRLVEALRLAFWIGLRVSQATADLDRDGTGDASWCLTASPCSVEEMQGLIKSFEAESPTALPWITVVSTESKLSIGGRPDTLEAFRKWVATQQRGSRLQLRSIPVNAPFHTRALLDKAAEAVRLDMHRRNIHTGGLADIVRPVYDNVSGKALGADECLVDSLLTSIMLETSRWDLMLEHMQASVVSTLVSDSARHFTVINAGPDNWYAADVAKRLSKAATSAGSMITANILAFAPAPPPSQTKTVSDLESLSSSPRDLPSPPPFRPRRVRGRPIAITAAFFAEIKEGTAEAANIVMDDAARHLNAQGTSSPDGLPLTVLLSEMFTHLIRAAPSAYFDDPLYSTRMGCFLNEEEPIKNEGLGVLRRLVNDHCWPDPSLLGHVSRPGILPTIHRASSCLKEDLCKFVLVGGCESVFGKRRRVAYLPLETLQDAQEAGTRPLAVILNSTADRPAGDHKLTITKLLDWADVEIDSVNLFMGADGKLTQACSALDLLHCAPQQSVFEAEAMENLLDYFGRTEGRVVSKDGIAPAEEPPRSLFYTVDAFSTVSALLCQAPTQQDPQLLSHFIGISGETEKELEQARARLQQFCRPRTDSVSLDDLSFATLTRPGAGSHRLGFTASTTASLIHALDKEAPVQKSGGPRIAFVFPGQGCQYPNMCRDLYDKCVPFRQRMDKCDRLVRAQGFPSFLSVVYEDLLVPETPVQKTQAGPASAPSQQEQASARDQADQLAIFSVEVSLAETLMEWGVQPTVVAGHSLGHYAACYIAGVLSLSDAIYLVARRSTLFRKLCAAQTSQMMAVAAEEADVVRHLSDAQSSATIACFNGPKDLVLSGTRDDLARLHTHLRSAGVKAKRLEVPFGFHSTHVSPVIAELARAAQTVTMSAPKIAITSNVLGRVVKAGERGVFDAAYFANHTRMPVRFAPSIHQASQDLGITDWVEVGPNPICLPMVKSTLGATATSALSTLKKGTDARSAIVATLGKLWVSGCQVAWKTCLLSSGQTYHNCHGLQLAGLSPRATPHSLSRRSTFDSLWSRRGSLAAQDAGEESTASMGPWLTAEEGDGTYSAPFSFFQDAVLLHCVAGVPVFSASLHGELALQAFCAASKMRCQDRHAIHLSELVFRAPLVDQDTADGGHKSLRVHVNPGTKQFSVSAMEHNGRPRTYMTGKVDVPDSSACASQMLKDVHAQTASRRILEMEREKRNDGAGYSTLASELAYMLFSTRVQYGKAYQSIQSVTISPRRHPEQQKVEAFCLIQVPLLDQSAATRALVKDTVLHPIIHDVMLHSGGLVANQSAHLVQPDESFIGAAVGDIQFSNVGAIKAERTYKMYVCVSPSGAQEVVTESYLFDEDASTVLGWARGIRFRKMQTSKLRDSLQASARTKAPPQDGKVAKSDDPASVECEPDEDYMALVTRHTSLLSGEEAADNRGCTMQQLASTPDSEESDPSDDSAQDEQDDNDLLVRLFPGLRGCDFSPYSPSETSISTPNTSEHSSPRRKPVSLVAPQLLSGFSHQA